MRRTGELIERGRTGIHAVIYTFRNYSIPTHAMTPMSSGGCVKAFVNKLIEIGVWAGLGN